MPKALFCAFETFYYTRSETHAVRDFNVAGNTRLYYARRAISEGRENFNIDK
jgi:hypothetical protein